MDVQFLAAIDAEELKLLGDLLLDIDAIYFDEQDRMVWRRNTGAVFLMSKYEIILEQTFVSTLSEDVCYFGYFLLVDEELFVFCYDSLFVSDILTVVGVAKHLNPHVCEEMLRRYIVAENVTRGDQIEVTRKELLSQQQVDNLWPVDQD
jgi:hypothetical protein